MRYDTEVNKGHINMSALATHLTKRGNDGWQLIHIFEQHGNTVMIYQQPDDPRLDHLIALQQETNRLLRQLLGDNPQPDQPASSTTSPPEWPTPPADKKRPWQR